MVLVTVSDLIYEKMKSIYEEILLEGIDPILNIFLNIKNIIISIFAPINYFFIEENKRCGEIEEGNNFGRQIDDNSIDKKMSNFRQDI